MRIIFLLYFLFTLLFVSLSGYSQSAKDNYSASSVLSKGSWYKAGITKNGVYIIEYEQLKKLGLDYPSNPRIYTNNCGQLSFYNNGNQPDDLYEIPVMPMTGPDGVLGEGDYILFYGEGPSKWRYNNNTGRYDYLKHEYSDTAFYFITSGLQPGKRIAQQTTPPGIPDVQSPTSDLLFIHEKDVENLLKSGREWYQPVSQMTGIQFNLPPQPLKAGKAEIRLRVVARSPASSVFRLYDGEKVLKSVQADPVNMFAYTGTYAKISDSLTTINLEGEQHSFSVRFFNNGEASARGWLDYFLFVGRTSNVYNGGQVFIRDSESIVPGTVTEFSVKNPARTPLIWNITDPDNPKLVSGIKTNDNLTFKSPTDSLETFILFDETSALRPVIRQVRLASQDLHASPPADMVIITHPLFRKYADALADLHWQNSGLSSMVVTPDEIYNEFSGGMTDVPSLRNFVRMKYLKQQGSTHPLKYLLLFGDGSFENRTPPPGNTSYIPTYQSQNSTVVVSSFTSDDFYGLLDDGEGEAEGTEDVGIGRLPVIDTTQAGAVLRKIRRYMNASNTGDWKNIIAITADDEDGNSHMSDAEGLSAFIGEEAPQFSVEKIYLDAYKQTTSVNGQLYPDVEKAINDRINKGCLIFNYIGHGNENGLAHERVIRTDQINQWNNGSRLPLFITATCEFSRFDDVDINIITGEITPRTSAGEMVLLNEKGGGIALMSTTRVVYSAPNYFLNKNIYDYAFEHDQEGNPLRLGDIIRLAKNSSGSGPNKRNFSLLGDPALFLEYPWHGNVVTDSIYRNDEGIATDTLNALSLVTVTGHIENPDGSPMNDFNGNLSSVVYDKSSLVRTLANDGGIPMSFETRTNLLFSGKTFASNGKFAFTFLVPRDIDYSFGKGRISYYASNNQIDVNGSYSDFIVGGFSGNTINDSSGPIISLFMNDTLFRNGGITGSNPRLLAIIEDAGGINTTGAGIGHDLSAFIDSDRNRSFVLNNYFETDLNNYSKGRLYYDLYDLSEGSHSLTLKAWDNYNNSTEETIRFFVEQDGKIVLTNLLNYPNPVNSETRITAAHNRSFSNLEVTIEIVDMSGRLIRRMVTESYQTGYQIEPVLWDVRDERGARVPGGIYLYRVTVRSELGETASSSGRMIIL